MSSGSKSFANIDRYAVGIVAIIWAYVASSYFRRMDAFVGLRFVGHVPMIATHLAE